MWICAIGWGGLVLEHEVAGAGEGAALREDVDMASTAMTFGWGTCSYFLKSFSYFA